jgi:hypothetical protein
MKNPKPNPNCKSKLIKDHTSLQKQRLHEMTLWYKSLIDYILQKEGRQGETDKYPLRTHMLSIELTEHQNKRLSALGRTPTAAVQSTSYGQNIFASLRANSRAQDQAQDIL